MGDPQASLGWLISMGKSQQKWIQSTYYTKSIDWMGRNQSQLAFWYQVDYLLTNQLRICHFLQGIWLIGHDNMETYRKYM